MLLLNLVALPLTDFLGSIATITILVSSEYIPHSSAGLYKQSLT